MKYLNFLIIIIIVFKSNFLNAQEQKLKNEITKNLRCLVCQGQSISDSNSDFAQTIKMVVDDLINEGLTEEEIYSFMSDKYGEWIVFKPQLNIQNSLLWILPYMALILGGFFIIKLFNKKNKIAE